jgi:vacuolar-type H+-ATPase subunit H
VIEHIFKSHPLVIPTVGQIKGVDFFVNNIPFDLKVTYLPSEYVRLKRKEMGLQSEVGFLKNNARMAGIKFDARGKEGDIVYEIVEKMKDRDDDLCREVLRTLENEKQEILKDSRSNPKILAKWLYENQGEMRFGSENRLFLVLVDTDDFNASWKLKRNFDILKPSINNYLDNFRTKNIEDLKLNFTFKGKPNSFNVLTDVIFVTK